MHMKEWWWIFYMRNCKSKYTAAIENLTIYEDNPRMLIFSHFTTSNFETSTVSHKPSPRKFHHRTKMSTSMDRVATGVTSTSHAPISPRAARSEEVSMLKKQDNLKDQRKKKNLNRQAFREQKSPLGGSEGK